jgi:hypothetical protein
MTLHEIQPKFPLILLQCVTHYSVVHWSAGAQVNQENSYRKYNIQQI